MHAILKIYGRHIPHSCPDQNPVFDYEEGRECESSKPSREERFAQKARALLTNSLAIKPPHRVMLYFIPDLREEAVARSEPILLELTINGAEQVVAEAMKSNLLKIADTCFDDRDNQGIICTCYGNPIA